MPAKHKPAFRFKNPNHRKARRQQRRLGVFGEDKFALRPFEHQVRETLRQRFVDFFEDITSH